MKNGVNDARRVQCSKSEHHGFHPANEECKWCAPPAATPPPRADIDAWVQHYLNYGAAPAAQRPHMYLDMSGGHTLDIEGRRIGVFRLGAETDAEYRWRIKDALGYTIK